MEKEANALVVEKADQELKVELVEKDGEYYLRTNIFDYIKDFDVRMINTEVLGKASN